LSLQKRLTAFTVTVVILASGSIGLYLIESSFRNQLNKVRSELISISETIDGSQVDKVTVALALVSASQSNISLFLAEENNEIIPLAYSSNDDLQIQAVRNVIDSENVLDTENVISQIVNIEGGLRLVLTASITSIYEERRSEFLRFSLYLLLVSIVALAMLRIVINKDVARESEELKLREKLKFEESRRKMLLEFASDTSHELRTPLTVIVGYLDLIKKRKSGKIEESALATMRQEASRLESNITSLLTMLELEVIEDESLTPVNLSELIEKELSSFQEIEQARKITVNIDKDLWIKGSQELALKLLRNILNNIRRHSNADSPVKVFFVGSAGFVELTIEDGGPLKASQSLNIEDYFTRFSSSRSLSKGGSGLGFSIMKKSASKLSGEISLFRSELGGLGIHIRIPKHDSIKQ
jgi:signal transduction histidine kinase